MYDPKINTLPTLVLFIHSPPQIILRKTLSLWGIPLVRRVVEKRSCLTVGYYTDHNVFDLGTLYQPRRKSQVGATLRLPVPGCACGRVRIAEKRKLWVSVGGWGWKCGAGEQEAWSVLIGF